MHLTVVDRHTNVARIRARQRPLLHLLHEPLQNRGHETAVNRPTDNAVIEDQLTAPVEVDLLLVLHVERDLLAPHFILNGVGRALFVGFDNKVHFAKLPCAPRLLLMAIVSLRDLGNRLAIRDARRKELYLTLMHVSEYPLHRIEVVFPLPRDDDLAELFRELYVDREVFLVHLIEELAQLLRFRLLHRLDRRTELIVRQLDGREGYALSAPH